MQFDEDSKLPDGATLPSVASGGGSGSSGSSTKPFTGKADADTTKDIINNGKISDDHIKQTMGSNFGKKPFDITLTDGSGNKVGQVVGGFNKDGTIIDDNKTEIPKPCGSSPASPAASSIAAPPLNNQSYDYIYKATGGKYGPFYITFESSDGKIRGYIKGTISNNSYSYKWSYTYQG
ncbi:hypothetical protein PWT90_04205 [Aphanocladium album]|nr:hypothetical protein PWT90_04205 [Aphanocladium album]